MKNSRNKVVWLVAGASALIVQSALSVVTHHIGQMGGEGPDFWGFVCLVTELPGAVVGEQLFGDTSPACLIFGVLSGAVEWFLVFALLIGAWKILVKLDDDGPTGADQAATKPADMAPVKDQPSTPASKDGHR